MYSVDEIVEALKANPVNMFHPDFGVDALRQALETACPGLRFSIGDFLIWQQPGVPYFSGAYAGDPANENNRLLHKGPVTMNAVQQLLDAKIIFRRGPWIAYQVKLTADRDQSPNAWFRFEVEETLRLNDERPVWNGNTAPDTDNVSVEQQSYAEQLRLNGFRCSDRLAALMLADRYQQSAQRDLQVLGIDWFFERCLLKPATTKVQGYFIAPHTWNRGEWEIRAKLRGTADVEFNRRLPDRLRKILTLAEAEAVQLDQLTDRK